jgi:hypothetical protein
MTDEEVISLALPFTESTCTTCGSEGAIGICSGCGGVRPDNSETDSLLHMRRCALSGMEMSVRLLAATLEDTPAGHVPCTGLQYGMVLADSDFLGEARRVTELFRQLNGLDLGDSKVVGSTLRRCILQLVEQVELVVGVRWNLMWFNPPESCCDLREMVDALARGAVGLARVTVEALTAGQVDSSRLAGELQSHLDAPVDFDRFCELLDVLKTDPDSVDDRVGVAFGLTGTYTDEYGRLDFARVLAAHAGSDEPLLEVAKRATHYLSHAIRDPQVLGSEAAVLALPASTLACLDRPLIGHRVAFELCETLWRAHAADARITRVLVERTLDDSPRLLASIARTETVQRRIAMDSDASPADAVSDLVELYATAAEAGFRSYSWLALDLEGITGGEEVSNQPEMPMLGEIAQRLAASSSGLAGLLAQAVSPGLRNAAKHEEYAVDVGGTSLDIRGGALAADELQDLTTTMVACVAGMDAAIAAWGLESGLLLAASPPGDDTAGADYARRVITRSLLRVSGGELLTVSWGPTVTLVARMQRPLVRASLLQVLAGISELRPTTEKLEMRDQDGALIVAALRESFIRFRDAGPETCAITALYGVFDAAVFIGEDSDEAAQDAVAVMIRLLTPEEIESGVHGPHEVTLRILAMRAAAIRTFIGVHSLGQSKLDEKFTALLRRAETAAMTAAGGDQGAFSRMLKALTPLFEWTTQRNADFNGLFRAW